MDNRYSVTTVILIQTFLIIFSSSIALANDIYVRNETLGLLHEGIKHIKAASKPYEKNIIEKIEISVPISPAPVRVRAFHDEGQRKIEISTGYSAITRMIVSGYLIENKLKIPNFGEEYARYSASTYATGRMGGGKPPWVIAKLSEDKTYNLLTDTVFNQEQQGAHLSVLWYILAHEVAHHVLNHKFGFDMALSKIQEQEKEADDWASTIFITMGLPPASAFPSHMYWYYLDEFSVLNEDRRSHPPELKRIRSMLQLTIDRFDDWNNNELLIPKLPKNETINLYKRLLVDVETLISEQTNFNSSKTSSTKFKLCLDIMHENCLNSCQKKHGNPLSLCKSKLCNSSRSKKIRKLKCSDVVS